MTQCSWVNEFWTIEPLNLANISKSPLPQLQNVLVSICTSHMKSQQWKGSLWIFNQWCYMLYRDTVSIWFYMYLAPYLAIIVLFKKIIITCCRKWRCASPSIQRPNPWNLPGIPCFLAQHGVTGWSSVEIVKTTSGWCLGCPNFRTTLFDELWRLWWNLRTQEQKKRHKSAENWRYKANSLPRVSENTLNNTFKTNIWNKLKQHVTDPCPVSMMLYTFQCTLVD